MVSVVLLTRAMPAANALVRRLRAQDAIDLVICEQPPQRRKASLATRIRWRADYTAQRLTRTLVSAEDAQRRVFGVQAAALDRSTPIETVLHRGWSGAVPILERVRPDVIAVFGTSILPSSIFGLARIATINLHSGLAPHYRGNNCVGFAILNEDVENIGATLHSVDQTIDGGAIVVQGRPEISRDDDELSLVCRVQEVAFRLLLEVIRRIRGGAVLTPQPQPPASGTLYRSASYTPAHARLVRRLVAEGALVRYLERKHAGRTREKAIIEWSR